jgi:hypothetical protein
VPGHALAGSPDPRQTCPEEETAMAKGKDRPSKEAKKPKKEKPKATATAGARPAAPAKGGKA